jgi:hypothetical protein
MTRLTLLFLIAALIVPGAASAVAPDRESGTRAAQLDRHGVDTAAADAKARAVEAYYSSYGTVKPAAIAASPPDSVTTDHTGPSWFGTLGIGVGLILIAGGLGVYAGRSLRPRHLGA